MSLRKIGKFSYWVLSSSFSMILLYISVYHQVRFNHQLFASDILIVKIRLICPKIFPCTIKDQRSFHAVKLWSIGTWIKYDWFQDLSYIVYSDNFFDWQQGDWKFPEKSNCVQLASILVWLCLLCTKWQGNSSYIEVGIFVWDLLFD